jgi:hypothetical protein
VFDEHSVCVGESGNRLPTRVLDVNFPNEVIALLETNADHGGLYALSYCWGNPLYNFTTTQSSLNDRKTGMRLSEIAKGIS